MPPDHLFCVIVGDNRLSVAETLIANFQVLAWDIKKEKKRNWGLKLQKFAKNQVVNKQFENALRAAELAKDCGVEGPDLTNETIKQSEEANQRLQCVFQ